MNGIIVKNSKINKALIIKAKGKFLVYCELVSTISDNLIFNNMIVNKNNTAIALT